MIIFISYINETNSFLGGLLGRAKILGACYMKLKVIRCFCRVFESFIYFGKHEILLSVVTNFYTMDYDSKMIYLMHVT